jgi:ParB family chromosome partitioning protein
MLQPILVRPAPHDPNAYEIVAGERRWRAAQQALLHEVPVISRALSHSEALEVALVENIQRQDLNPLEEADAYRRLLEEFDYTQEVLAKDLGKSRSHIANTIRLLSLPDEAKQALDEGLISAGHARALLAADDPVAMLRVVLDKGLTVRETEALVKAPPTNDRPRRRPEKDADTRALESRLSTTLGLKVALDHKSSGSGNLRIRYQSLEQLDDVCQRLGVSTIPA